MNNPSGSSFGSLCTAKGEGGRERSREWRGLAVYDIILGLAQLVDGKRIRQCSRDVNSSLSAKDPSKNVPIYSLYWQILKRKQSVSGAKRAAEGTGYRA